MSRLDTVLAFDAYGTLLSTESIAKKLAGHFGQDKATTIAATWRKYQLEYTWRSNSMKQYEDFSKITLRSLRHALAESAVSLDQKAIDELMEAYNSLSIFPDVAPALTAISKASGLHAVVFSNGTHDMVSSSVNKSPDLSPYASVFKDIVVVEEIKCFKPDPEVYYHLARKVGKNPDTDMGSMWLISGNPFDVVGARTVGMKALWVDRAGNGWQDELVAGDVGQPTAIVKSLEEVLQVVNE
ncbi:hypothetical protein AAFC00_006695 [Neodothiora populina]|uniref:Haloacid dehalogenase n=1 Tax=Neodothiora populina TaxID=2781224 RepID=A0ABR3PB90_9PEZI